MVAAVTKKGYRVASSTRPGETSGIVSVEIPGGDATAAAAALAEQKISCAVRDGRIRVSCHIFNNADDIGQLAAALPAADAA